MQIGARVEEEGLDAHAFDAFWSAAQTLNVPVIVHPADLAVPLRHRRLFLHILAGNPSETTYAAAALLLGGVFDRFPKLRVLLVHGGGCVPYQFGRIDRGASPSPPVRPRLGAGSSSTATPTICITTRSFTTTRRCAISSRA